MLYSVTLIFCRQNMPLSTMIFSRLQWSNDSMEKAMSDVRERNMTLRGAAKKHSVPYSTLKDRIQGRVMHGTKPGVKTVLSPEEENDLVLCIQVLTMYTILYCRVFVSPMCCTHR